MRRARRHPWAILGLYGWQSVLAVMAVSPFASLAGAAYGNDPRRDAPLWAAGGHALLDFLQHEKHGLVAAGSSAAAILLLGLIAGLVPMAAALVAIACTTRAGRNVGLTRSLAAGFGLFPAMLTLLVITGVLLVFLALAGLAIGDVVEAWCHKALGEAHAQQIAAVAVLPLILAASVVGVVQDLARSAVVRFDVGAWRGLSFGVATFRRTPIAVWWSWAWRATASLVPVAAVALVSGAVVLAALHQAVIVARIAIHLSWWSRALRAVEPPRATPG
jgi:hypothetical protein